MRVSSETPARPASAESRPFHDGRGPVVAKTWEASMVRFGRSAYYTIGDLFYYRGWTDAVDFNRARAFAVRVSF